MDHRHRDGRRGWVRVKAPGPARDVSPGGLAGAFAWKFTRQASCTVRRSRGVSSSSCNLERDEGGFPARDARSWWAGLRLRPLVCQGY